MKFFALISTLLCSLLMVIKASDEKKIKIQIAGTVELEHGEVSSTSPKAKALHGLHYDGVTMAEYIGHTKPDKPFKSIGLSGGYITLTFDKQLWVVTEYTSPRHLTAKELSWLIEYTQGQWSDGVGETPQQIFSLSKGSPNIYLAPVDQLLRITTKG